MQKNKAQAVEPIRNKADIEKIKRYFLRQKQYRNYCLFVCGINLGLRISDLLKLRISDIYNKTELRLTEQKTNKSKVININEACQKAVRTYLNSLSSFDINDYLFKSRKGSGAINKKTAHQIINDACLSCNIKGNFGTHSLRKTFAYQLYINNSDNVLILEYIMQLLNHKSQATTIRYLGLEKEKLDGFVNELNL